jgi:hypothetical protein
MEHITVVCTRGELQRPPATVLRCARRLLTRDKALYQSCTYPALRLPARGPLAAEEGDPRRSHTHPVRVSARAPPALHTRQGIRRGGLQGISHARGGACEWSRELSWLGRERKQRRASNDQPNRGFDYATPSPKKPFPPSKNRLWSTVHASHVRRSAQRPMRQPPSRLPQPSVRQRRRRLRVVVWLHCPRRCTRTSASASVSDGPEVALNWPFPYPI